MKQAVEHRQDREDPAGGAPSISSGALERVIEEWRHPGERLYAVIDTARNIALGAVAQTCFPEGIRWLFPPDTPAHMANVAPYMVPIEFTSESEDPGRKFLGLWETALGTSCGILLLSETDPVAVHAHLRRVFHMTDDAGKEYFFRFYDPRVLRCVMQTFDGSEARELFGPVRLILCESDQAGAIRICSAETTGIGMEEAPLESTP